MRRESCAGTITRFPKECCTLRHGLLARWQCWWQICTRQKQAARALRSACTGKILICWYSCLSFFNETTSSWHRALSWQYRCDWSKAFAPCIESTQDIAPLNNTRTQAQAVNTNTASCTMTCSFPKLSSSTQFRKHCFYQHLCHLVQQRDALFSCLTECCLLWALEGDWGL